MEYLCHKWPQICSTCGKHFPHSWLITGFVTRLTRLVPPVEPELLTIPEHMSSPPDYSIFSFMCMFCRSLFVLSSFFPLTIVLSVHLRYTDSSNSSYIFINTTILNMRNQQECERYTLSELLLTRKYEHRFPAIDVLYQLLSTFKM